MNEHKLFHIYIQPKNPSEVQDTELYDFRIVAEDPIMALTKVMALPDINYMYVECRDDIIIKYEGFVY